MDPVPIWMQEQARQSQNLPEIVTDPRFVNVPRGGLPTLHSQGSYGMEQLTDERSKTPTTFTTQPTLLPLPTVQTSLSSSLGKSVEVASSVEDFINAQNSGKTLLMESFPTEEVTDFKHLIYNLLVDYYNSTLQNNPNNNPAIKITSPCCITDATGKLRQGFRFMEKNNPEKRIPELYVQHLKVIDLFINSPLL
jgi:hypothetical protein